MAYQARLLLLLSLWILPSGSRAEEDPTRYIGTRTQLLVDDFVISER